MLAHLGAMLAHLDVGGHVRPSWGYDGAMLPHLGPFWPILGLCWPIWGLCWGHVRPSWGYVVAMLPHLGLLLDHVVDPRGDFGLCCFHDFTFIPEILLEKSLLGGLRGTHSIFATPFL